MSDALESASLPPHSAQRSGDWPVDAEWARMSLERPLVDARRFEDPSTTNRGRIWPGPESRPADSVTPSHCSIEFLAVISHEFRNSLSAIGGAVAILGMEAPLPPAAMTARSMIERQVAQMARLVEDLLDVSRIGSGQLRLRCQRVDLCAVVARSMDSAAPMMRQRAHRLTGSSPEAPVWLRADPARLEQVLANLLGNAAKYTDPGGEIHLSVERGEHEAIVCVRDTGIGIPPEVLPTLFRLFVQADPDSPRTDGGLGIGLALVRSLIESHGGRISVQSAGPRQGTQFTIHLPLCAAPLATVASETERTVPNQAPADADQ